MTIYELSKKDRTTILSCANLCEACSNSYYKLWSANWLCWYRRFYRLNDKESMKRNIKFFIEEISNIKRGKRV